VIIAKNKNTPAVHRIIRAALRQFSTSHNATQPCLCIHPSPTASQPAASSQPVRSARPLPAFNATPSINDFVRLLIHLHLSLCSHIVSLFSPSSFAHSWPDLSPISALVTLRFHSAMVEPDSGPDNPHVPQIPAGWIAQWDSRYVLMTSFTRERACASSFNSGWEVEREHFAQPVTS
jgi:hypothetical protein